VSCCACCLLYSDCVIYHGRSSDSDRRSSRVKFVVRGVSSLLLDGYHQTCYDLDLTRRAIHSSVILRPPRRLWSGCLSVCRPRCTYGHRAWQEVLKSHRTRCWVMFHFLDRGWRLMRCGGGWHLSLHPRPPSSRVITAARFNTPVCESTQQHRSERLELFVVVSSCTSLLVFRCHD